VLHVRSSDTDAASILNHKARPRRTRGTSGIEALEGKVRTCPSPNSYRGAEKLATVRVTLKHESMPVGALIKTMTD
jgi:hypothetical protein